ncbi:MAG: cellulase family glycosylhydrolase, partial [Gemmatimonadetes bacterium]|nr:cellulase family glycosylhydrolase [Gemmatimonadota bacterium]
AKYDNIVGLADKYGLEIIARLSSTPEWARTQVTGSFAPPDHYSDFADYAAAVAQRYRGRVTHFQVWNEPNGNGEWGNQPVRMAQEEEAEMTAEGTMRWVLRRQSELHLVR